MRQCSLVLVRTALGSRMPVPEFLLLVLIQHISSHLLKPQFCKHNLPRSRPSLLPHHRNTKLLLALTSPISKAIILSQSQNFTFDTPYARLYSSNGGSMMIVSNLQLSCFKS